MTQEHASRRRRRLTATITDLEVAVQRAFLIGVVLPGMSEMQLGIAEDEPLGAGASGRFVQLAGEAAVAAAPAASAATRQQQLQQPAE